MKHVKYIFLITTALVLLFSSCEPEPIAYDEGLLLGKWQSQLGKKTEFYRYDADYTGVHWDTADDVLEEEGLLFEWELEMDDLSHFHIITIGENKVPKFYKVTELTATTLKYKDDFGNQFSFLKVTK